MGGETMKFHPIALFVLALLLYGVGTAQEKALREVDLHRNVRLVLMPIPADMPEDLRERYADFLPLFEEALKAHTSDRPAESALTIRLVPKIKEIGSAKKKRAVACVTAFRRDSNKEFLCNFLIYSYVTGDTVNREEIEQFLNQQILGPMGVT